MSLCVLRRPGNAVRDGLHVLCSNELRLLDHRLLWWMLAHQEKSAEGVATGVVPAGWRSAAARELEVSDVAMWKSQVRLKRAGIIELAPYQRSARIRGEAFSL